MGQDVRNRSGRPLSEADVFSFHHSRPKLLHTKASPHTPNLSSQPAARDKSIPHTTATTRTKSSTSTSTLSSPSDSVPRPDSLISPASTVVPTSAGSQKYYRAALATNDIHSRSLVPHVAITPSQGLAQGLISRHPRRSKNRRRRKTQYDGTSSTDPASQQQRPPHHDNPLTSQQPSPLPTSMPVVPSFTHSPRDSTLKSKHSVSISEEQEGILDIAMDVRPARDERSWVCNIESEINNMSEVEALKDDTTTSIDETAHDTSNSHFDVSIIDESASEETEEEMVWEPARSATPPRYAGGEQESESDDGQLSTAISTPYHRDTSSDELDFEATQASDLLWTPQTERYISREISRSPSEVSTCTSSSRSPLFPHAKMLIDLTLPSSSIQENRNVPRIDQPDGDDSDIFNGEHPDTLDSEDDDMLGDPEHLAHAGRTSETTCVCSNDAQSPYSLYSPLHDISPPRPVQRNLVIGRHISTDGGLVRAAEFLVDAFSEGELRGASMNIHVTKKSVDEGLSFDPRLREKQIATRALESPTKRAIKLRLTKDLAFEEAGKFKDKMSALGNEFSDRLIVHAVHTTNLASLNPLLRARSKESLILELQKAKHMGVSTLVFHLGACRNTECAQTTEMEETEMNKHDDEDTEHAASEDEKDEGEKDRSWDDVRRDASQSIREILEEVPGMVLAIENMTHYRHGETSRSLDNLRQLIDDVGLPGRVKVCIDLCHIYIDQYDLYLPSGREAFFAALDRLGMENVAAVHVSDSGVEHGGPKDCHKNIGFGMINVEAFREILGNPRLKDVLLIFETPPYYHGNRSAGSALGRKIAYGEHERHCAEEGFVDAIVSLSEEDWLEEKASGSLWIKYKKRRAALETTIYRMLERDGGPQMGKFKGWREKSNSQTVEMRWMKRNRAERLAELEGSPICKPVRTTNKPEIELATTLSPRRLRSDDRR